MVTLQDVAVRGLLPTPVTDPDSHNGHARDLGSEARLLPTPLTSDERPGSAADLRRKTPALRAVERLLPTPVTTDAASADRSTTTTGVMHSGTSLTDAVRLLPTPIASAGKHGSAGQTHGEGGASLAATAPLLPTPNPFHAGNTETPTEWLARRAEVEERTGTRHGMALPVVALSIQEGAPLVQDGSGPHREPVGDDAPWGIYSQAVARWETTVGRPAPSPTESGTRGATRLSPRFVEWMMGLPDGWVVDAAGLWAQEDLFGTTDAATTRAEQLKMLGNGVVPAQAAAAIADLLTDIPDHVLAALRGEQQEVAR